LNASIHDKNIRLGITFWGERVITVQGEEGSVSLHAVADKVVSIICVRCLSQKDWLSDETPDKVQAKLVVDHLDQYYSQTDTLIAREKNYFTWILAKIRDFGSTAVRAHADIEYLQGWSFKVGYKIRRCSIWVQGNVPAWAKD
jgi:hypothetical protein